MLVSTDKILSALVETLQMVTVSFVFSILLGIPLGVLLYVTRSGGICLLYTSDAADDIALV